jgi:hypothetical protein
MTAQSKTLNPLESYSNEQLEILAFLIAGKLKGVIVDDRPMNGEEAIAWSGWSRNKFFSLVNAGKIKARRPTPESDPSYLKSDIIEYLKSV